MQGKRTKMKIFPSEERKQSKNHCSPVKLESKKNDKKSNRPVEASGWEASSDRLRRATSRLEPRSLPSHPHTLCRKQRHENKHSRMQGKWSKVKFFTSEERNTH